MMTVSPITSEQKQHFEKMLARAVKRARKEANPGRDGMQRLFARGGEFEDWYVAGILRFTAKLPDYTLAKSILGGDFISPEEIMTARPDVVYSPEQIGQLAATIPSEEVLRSLKANGYGLMPNPPEAFPLLAVRTSKPSHFYTKTGGWYEDHPFARNDLTGNSGWTALKKSPVADSTNKNWNEQIKLISGVEYVPNVAEASWFITIFFDVRGVRLFEKVYVRTSSLDSDGDRVLVGYFGAVGLRVISGWDSSRRSFLGLASARKV
jgi:hypothetical protein